MSEREEVRLRLRDNRLSSTWLINMLRIRGVETDRSTLSAIFAGTRNGCKVDEIVSTSLSILDNYEDYLKGETACS